MKQMLSTIAIIFFTVITSPVGALAQVDKNTFAYNSFSSFDPVSSGTEKRTYMNDINIKAVRDFIKSFKNVTNEKWYRVSDGFIAHFTQDGIETKVAYDQKGVFHCTLRTLNESQLPTAIRAAVKSKYYDFKILVAYEITHDSDPVYIFKIEDSKTLKMLRVVDGEIEIITDNIKG